MTEQNRVQWVYSSQNEQELEERYDRWAEEYDADLEADFGWISPQRTAETFARHVPRRRRHPGRRGRHRTGGAVPLRLGLPATDRDGPVPRGCWK